jgi:hypothetical protein
MLTKNEITALNLSPTKKDFVQIWNELLEVAGRLSERWDPTSTNESDPGIVILKALTGIADKLNYNIDKNTLEAFMPTAAQEESMRKLCDMLGYNVKYYRSAETTVTFKYYNAEPSDDESNVMQGGLLTIPKFTVLSNGDQDINYFTINQAPEYITSTTPSIELPCMEGQIVKCESTTDNNIITADQISDNNRFYLPEYRIAENGIFVYNVAFGQDDGECWTKVDNLNIQPRGSKVFKFGYDSYEGRPYLEFPEDWSSLLNDGLFIYYTRTSGADGNISARTISQFELPKTEGWDKVSIDSFSVENSFAATTGSDIETINQAYNNFKKTVGTFETLVTCRDYMNKIYSLTDEYSGKFLVSNALVTDIRSDLNRAVVICSCDDAGIFYKETALVEDTVVTTRNDIVSTPKEDVQETVVISETNKPFYSDSAEQAAGSQMTTHWFLDLGNNERFALFDFNVVKSGGSAPMFDNNEPGEVLSEYDDGTPSDYWLIKQNDHLFTSRWPIEKIVSTVTTITQEKTSTITEKLEASVPAINYFDLVLYPFKSYNQLRSNIKDVQEVYDASFKYNHNSFKSIETLLNETTSTVKTIAHNIVAPRAGDLISINNYLKLNAIISTTSKITTEESDLLKEKIKITLANAFNMRELDFGEEIPFDSILSVIKNADTRISVVSLAEPALYTTFSVLEGFDDAQNPILKEYAVASEWLSEEYANNTDRFEYSDNTYTFDTTKAREIYNKLAVRNVLAGRVPLFKYNNTFKSNFAEAPYRVTEEIEKAEIPANLVNVLTPTAEDPVVIYAFDGVVYTAQSVADTVKYTKTYVPEEYVDNIITKDPEDDNNIVKITTSCKVKAPNVTLAEGEFIKFRAPNFITVKTFPAYVNYHLALNKEIHTEARYAEADTLYNLLNRETEAGLPIDEKRQKVLDYFSANDKKKTFKLIQTILRTTINNTGNNSNSNITNKFYLVIDNPSDSSATNTIDVESILLNSSFVRLINKEAIVKWASDENNQSTSSTGPNISIPPLKFTSESSFITSIDTFTAIQQEVDAYLATLDSSEFPINRPWTIEYNFEYAPLEPDTLSVWEAFLSTCDKAVFGFLPVIEHGTALWYTNSNSYTMGKYVMPTSYKLLPLAARQVNSLEKNRLQVVYVAKDLGTDLKPNFVSNNEEYMLKANEYLFIEYTPSSTTEDGTTQEQSSVQEVYEAGTIIRPSGFVEGLKDSSKQMETGTSAYKTVNFATTTVTKSDVQMYSLGASEQIEIRDFAHVILNKETLPDTSTIYLYKNFNDCDELEYTNSADSNGERHYTLKDGEYICYTDQNKAEFAYFASGTEVILTGNLVLPKFDQIDLAVIFDSGITEIPWARLYFSGEDSITFQEFQYITLGAGDTLESIQLAPNQTIEEYYLDEQWRACDEVVYTPVGDETPTSLPKINTLNNGETNGNGWEACSILELNVSPNKAQALRSTDEIDTSISLYKGHSSGVSPSDKPFMTISPSTAGSSMQPISIKANMSCQTSNSKLNISDVYLNPNKLKSFELKVFSSQEPTIVKTKPGSLVPITDGASTVDILDWPIDNTKYIAAKSSNDIWTSIELTKIKSTDDTFDNALKLSACLLPNTYGIFSIYLSASDFPDAADATTWLELLPGTYSAGMPITLLNTASNNAPASTMVNDTVKLTLKPGLNCIKINQTCDMFIKTNSDKGGLMFDDLRLVDCQPIEYIENGHLTKQKTQGINLEQLGYLAIANADTLNTFDMQVRKKLKEDYTDEALAALNVQEQAASDSLSSLLDELLIAKPKLQILTEFLANACEEIQKLKTDASNDFEGLAALFVKYKELYEDIGRETSLRDALVANSDISQLEQQLAAILETFGTAETIKQELLENLDSLNQVIQSNKNIFNSVQLSKGDILDDFESYADSADSKLLNDLKLASIKEINAEYTNNLTALATAMTAVAEDESQARLRSILEDLYATQHTELLSQINVLLETNQTSLQEMVATAKSLAVGTDSEVDYEALYVILTDLKSQLAITDIEDLLAELEHVLASNMANNDKYTRLAELVAELKRVISDTATGDIINYASLANTIDTLIATVQTKISSKQTNVDNAIVDALEDFEESMLNVYLAQVTELLSQLQLSLTALNDDYETNITLLETTENESAKAILGMLESYVTAKKAQMNQVSLFGTGENFNIQQDYIRLPYGVISVLAVWPSYMQRDFIVGTDSLHKSILDVINNPTDVSDLTIDNSFFTKRPNGDLRQVLVTAANLDAFKQLFKQAKEKLTIKVQNTSRKEFINQLGMLTSSSPALQTAITAILVENDDKLAVIRQLLEQLSSKPTVADKQRLVKELEAAVEEAIKIDTELFNICAALLCPSVLSLATALPDATTDAVFYSKLSNYINSQLTEENSGILALISSDESSVFRVLDKFDEIYDYLFEAQLILSDVFAALTNDNINKFNYWSAVAAAVSDNTENESRILLATSYLDCLTKIRAILDIQEQITAIKSHNLLTVLQDYNLVVAWQDDNYNWRDSSGNYYQRYTAGTWLPASEWLSTDLVNTTAQWINEQGYWRDSAGNFVKVDFKRDYIEAVGSGASSGVWKDCNGTEVDITDVAYWVNAEGDLVTVTNETLANILKSLFDNVNELGKFNIIPAEVKAAYSIWCLEEQLLNDIRRIDKNHEFYYNAPIESHVAINFNEGDSKLNTLMNPAVNYDINNINNNFVISKLDINYITTGLKIARSSTLN